MRRFAMVLAVLAACWPRPAAALTVRDVVELTRAGLGEETLLALIDVDASVFPIDARTLTSLKTAGVSERVIVAMIRSGRNSTAALAAESAPAAETTAAEPAPAAQVIVVEHHDQAPQIEIREVPVAVPVYIPIRERDRDGAGESPRRPREKPEPVYWGWGGKLRPDAWQPQ
ncbi:MAG: hypothetical protein ABJC51_09985 [Acidobacteriota bacterium]